MSDIRRAAQAAADAIRRQAEAAAKAAAAALIKGMLLIIK